MAGANVSEPLDGEVADGLRVDAGLLYRRGVREIPRFALDDERAVVLAVPPAAEVGVAAARHVERRLRRRRDAYRGAVLREQLHAAAIPQPRASLQLEVVLGHRQRLRRAAAGIRIEQLGGGVPALAVGLLAHRVHQAAVVELRRRPDPVEAGGRAAGRWRGRRLAAADGPDAPRVVADAPPVRRIDRVRAAGSGERARPAAVLRHARVVHEGAVADAPEEMRLLKGLGDALEHHVEREAVFVGLGVDVRLAQRLDDLDADRSDLRVHPVGAQLARGAHDVLGLAVDDGGREGVDDADVGVDAHRHHEIGVAFQRVGAEVVAVVEVAVAGADSVDRLGCLVYQVIVEGREHVDLRSLCERGSGGIV